MLTETQKANPDVAAVLEIAFTSGTKYYSSVGAGLSTQLYQEKVVSWPVIKRAVSDGDSLESVTYSATVLDHDFEFSKLIATDGIKALRGAAVTLKLVSPNVTDANAFTLFEGKFVGFQPSGPLEYRFDFRMDDTALESVYPKIVVGGGNFPLADAGANDKPIPLVEGVHSADGVTSGGMVPTLYVNTATFEYAVCVGYADVPEVFVDGVEQSSGFTITHPMINGVDYTVVDFDADQDTSEVTVNVEGYDADADGGGARFTNPAEQLKHLLVNFVFGNYKTGAWLLDSSAPVNTTHWTESEDFLDQIAAEGSRWIGGSQRSGLDTIREWLDNHGLKAFWTNDGKLAIRPDDPFETTLYIDDAWVRWEQAPGDPESFNQEYDDSRVVSEFSVSYIYGEADAQFFDNVLVADPSVGDMVSRELKLLWAVSRI